MTKFKGVYDGYRNLDPRASLQVAGVKYYYCHKNKEVCALVYDALVRKLGVDRPLNFPDRTPEFAEKVAERVIKQNAGP